MTMCTRIDIENPGADTLDIRTEWEERVELFDPYFSDADGTGNLTIEETAKYQKGGIHEFAIEYTSLYPEATVTIREEWTGEEGPSIDVVTYENGAAVDERVSREVPANLDALIADARTALQFDTPAPATVDALHGTLTALVDALDPKGAKA